MNVESLALLLYQDQSIVWTISGLRTNVLIFARILAPGFSAAVHGKAIMFSAVWSMIRRYCQCRFRTISFLFGLPGNIFYSSLK